jgi:predicted nuclease of predicted toxin-antitoxin system
MNFPLIIIDESVDGRISAALETASYDVYLIIKNLPGIDDIEVIKLAIERHAYIITEDKDFGDEIIYKKSPHNGTLLLRLSGIAVDEKISLVLKTLKLHKEELLKSFAVLTSKKLRIRK